MPTRGEANLSAAAGGLVVRLGRMARVLERRAREAEGWGRREASAWAEGGEGWAGGSVVYRRGAAAEGGPLLVGEIPCDSDSVPVVQSRGGRPR